MERLRQKYTDEVQNSLMSDFGIKNRMAVPKLIKIVISVALGEAKDNAGVLEKVKTYLRALSGQTPLVTYAKKSISAFKVSKGQPVGMIVTLRGEKMYAFLDKLINVVLPKVRDFKGISESSFDENGNLNIGIREQVIFPEVDYQTVDRIRGLGITIVAKSKSREQKKKLLEYLGMPFKN